MSFSKELNQRVIFLFEYAHGKPLYCNYSKHWTRTQQPNQQQQQQKNKTKTKQTTTKTKKRVSYFAYSHLIFSSLLIV